MSLSALSGAPSLLSGSRAKAPPASTFDLDFDSVLGGEGGGATSSKSKKGKPKKKSVKFTEVEDESGEFGGPASRNKKGGSNPYLDEDDDPLGGAASRQTGGGFLGSGGALKTSSRRQGAAASAGLAMPKGRTDAVDSLDALSGHTVGIKRALSKEGACDSGEGST